MSNQNCWTKNYISILARASHLIT